MILSVLITKGGLADIVATTHGPEGRAGLRPSPIGRSETGAAGAKRQAQGDSCQSGLAGREQATTLSRLIKKGGLVGGMAATFATPATQETETSATVATVATVAVAQPIKNGGLVGGVAATFATPATQETKTPATVATVATVAVADTPEPLLELSQDQEADVRTWLAHIEETDPEIIAEVMDKCRHDLKARRYYLKRSEEVTKR